MQWRYLVFIFVAFSLLLPVILTYFSKKPESWAVYYTKGMPPEAFGSYDLLVFNSEAHPPLRPLITRHRILLGYISLGEAETYHQHYSDVKALGVTMEHVSDWNGNPLIDARKTQWRYYILNTIIPDILKQGFNGIMIDTVDNLIWLEKKDPVQYAGMQRAAIQLIKDIRAKFPQIYIMQNRGFELLPYVGNDINMVLAESIYTNWNKQTHQPEMSPSYIYDDYVNRIKTLQKQFPKLKIYTLDYWRPDDSQTIKAIYKKQRSYGFIPYVSTIDLQSLIAEPEEEN